MSLDVEKTSFSIITKDEVELSAALFSPQTEHKKGAIVFNAGTCILKEFYDPYCHYLAQLGFEVLNYDYRGVGKSKSKKDVSIISWAQNDMQAVIAWAQHRFSHLPIHLFAHSMGGQVIGLCPNIDQIHTIVTIASSYGNWQFYENPKRRRKTAFGVHVLMPIYCLFVGKVPMKIFGQGEDYPKGVAKNIGAWNRYPWPHSRIMNKLGVPHYYRSIQQRLFAFFIEDDPIATASTIPCYKEDFAQADLHICTLNPHDLGKTHIGHMGFFSTKNQDLWPMTIEGIL